MKLEKIRDCDSILKTEYDKRYQVEPIEPDTIIYTKNREKTFLNGKWNFSIDQYDTILRQGSFIEGQVGDMGKPIPEDHRYDMWEEVNVPSTWNNQNPEYLNYEGTCWYTREFEYSKSSNGKMFLKFNGAAYECRVWLNGYYLGRHEGGSTPFNFEVSNLLEKQNRILVYVNNTRRAEGVPALNTDWYNYGGLFRSVELVEVPENYIKDCFIRLKNESDFKKVMVDIEVSGKDSKATLFIDELNIEEEIDIVDGKGTAEFEGILELWSPENPKIYDYRLIYEGDEIKDNIGFREIRVDGTKIVLNGKDIYLKGISMHEDSVVNGRSLTLDEMRENLSLAKELGCNYVRLAHYPHSEEMVSLACEMGLMVWNEIPVYWALEFTNPKTIKCAQNQMAELILRDRNKANVILWSVGNENPDTDDRFKFMSDLVKLTKSLDDSRLVTAACLTDHGSLKISDRLTEVVDVIGINEYYGWYDRSFEGLKSMFDNSGTIDKPIIISEVGGGALSKNYGDSDKLFTEDCQEEIYLRQTQMLEGYPVIKGISPWILYDFRCPRRLNEYQQGYNLKGLLDKEKKHRKKAFYVLQNYYLNKSR